MSDNNNNNNSAAGGIGLSGLLGVAFIVLKLCKVINWPWLWVLSPFWISFAIFIVVTIIIAVIAVRHEKRLGRW